MVKNDCATYTKISSFQKGSALVNKLGHDIRTRNRFFRDFSSIAVWMVRECS